MSINTLSLRIWNPINCIACLPIYVPIIISSLIDQFVPEAWAHLSAAATASKHSLKMFASNMEIALSAFSWLAAQPAGWRRCL